MEEGCGLRLVLKNGLSHESDGQAIFKLFKIEKVRIHSFMVKVESSGYASFRRVASTPNAVVFFVKN